MCFRSEIVSFPIYFQSEIKRFSSKQIRVWDKNWIKTALGSVCELLTFVHAIARCEEDIVSVYGGNAGKGFDKLHYRRFIEKLATSKSSVQVHTLPQSF